MYYFFPLNATRLRCIICFICPSRLGECFCFSSPKARVDVLSSTSPMLRCIKISLQIPLHWGVTFTSMPQTGVYISISCAPKLAYVFLFLVPPSRGVSYAPRVGCMFVKLLMECLLLREALFLHGNLHDQVAVRGKSVRRPQHLLLYLRPPQLATLCSFP